MPDARPKPAPPLMSVYEHNSLTIHSQFTHTIHSQFICNLLAKTPRLIIITRYFIRHSRRVFCHIRTKIILGYHCTNTLQRMAKKNLGNVILCHRRSDFEGYYNEEIVEICIGIVEYESTQDDKSDGEIMRQYAPIHT